MREDRRPYDEAEQAGRLLRCQIALEVKDIRTIRDEFGKPFRDLIHHHFGDALRAALGADAWRFYQYEFAAQAVDAPAAHRAMGRLELWLSNHPVLVTCPDTTQVQLQIGFVYGLGEDRQSSREGVVGEHEGGELGVGEILGLPDGAWLQAPGRTAARLELRHPDETLRRQRAAHRYLTEAPPQGLRMWRKRADGTTYELSPDEVDIQLEYNKLRAAERERWVVPWRTWEPAT